MAALLAAAPDVLVVAAYGLILPQWVLDLPRLGCFNIHASILPRWRGAAPIHRAIEAGDAETGVTIMQMDAGLDTGDMLLVERVPIHAGDSTATLHDRLAALGGRVDGTSGFAPGMKGQIDAGKLRLLAVTTPQRLAAYPSVPTLAESGLPGYEASAWQLLLVAGGHYRRLLDAHAGAAE